MPRSRNLHFYPTEFFEIAEAVGANQKVTIIQCVNTQQARSLAGKYYSFVGALKAKVAGYTKDDLANDPDAKFHERLLPFAHKVQVTLCDKNGKEGANTNELTGCKFQHRSESWYAQALRRGLADALDAGERVSKIKEELTAPTPTPTTLAVVPGSTAGGKPPEFFSPEAVAARLAAKERQPVELEEAKRSSEDLLKELGVEPKPEKEG